MVKTYSQENITGGISAVYPCKNAGGVQAGRVVALASDGYVIPFADGLIPFGVTQDNKKIGYDSDPETGVVVVNRTSLGMLVQIEDGFTPSPTAEVFVTPEGKLGSEGTQVNAIYLTSEVSDFPVFGVGDIKCARISFVGGL